MRLGFLLADHQQCRDLRQRMLADLVVDLLVAQVDLDAQAARRAAAATTLAYSSPSEVMVVTTAWIGASQSGKLPA